MEKLRYIARTLANGSKKIFETYVINAIYQKIDNPNLIIETQQIVKFDDGNYSLLDLYLPQLKLAIEIDESYHKDNKLSDMNRELLVKKQDKKICIANNIDFKRVQVYDSSLEEVNNRINELVDEIKLKIDSLTQPLIWKSHDEEVQEIKDKGLISLDDSFRTNVEIINLVFNKNYKNWYKGTYKNIWFPVISEVENGIITDKAGWQNFYNKSHSIIYERNIDKEINDGLKTYSLNEKRKKEERIVFAKETNCFNTTVKRFAGVFRECGWDDEYDARIWKLVKTEIKIPLTL